MKYYDILWTGKDDIDSKINVAFSIIKKKVDIGFKKEAIKNKYDAPRSFWFIEKEENKFIEVMKYHQDVIEYFKGKSL